MRYFLAVAEAGSFSRAANRLGVTQPNISQQMRDLEAGLRVALFQRRGKRIFLTSAGQIFQDHSRAILRQVENFLEELSSEPEQMRGALHVGVVPILNAGLMPQLLGKFAQEHPGIRINVEEISSADIETALEEGRMDVGFGYVTRHSPNLYYDRLCGDEFALIVHKTHPWAKRRLIDVGELHQARLLQLPDSFVMRRMANAICREHHVRPRTVAEIDAFTTLVRSLEPLQAATLMPKIALLGTTDLLAIPLKGKNLSLEIGLLRLLDSESNPAVREFTNLARAVVPGMLGEEKLAVR